MKTSTKSVTPFCVFALMILVGASVSVAQEYGSKKDSRARMGKEQAGSAVIGSTLTKEKVQDIIKNWDQKQIKTINSLMQKYGAPSEATHSMLVWHEQKPWKRIVVSKDMTDHDFPVPHQDYVHQFVDYKIESQTVDEITEFDGSVYVDRTRGELSARCDKEPMNILALNLADDIFKGEKNVEEARKAYLEHAMNFMQGQPSEYVKSLQFNPPKKAGDPGEALATPKK